MQEAWTNEVRVVDPTKILNERLRNTARAVKIWSRGKIGNTKLQPHIALEVLQVDRAQEHRSLAEVERQLRKELKMRILGLAVIQRMRWRQRSRITWLKLGDADAKFFHLKANSRKRKNFIRFLQNASGLCVTHEDKEEPIRQHFTGIVGNGCTV